MAACGWRVAERQRDNEGRNTQRGASRGERACYTHARNAFGKRPGARVLTSQRCVHVKEVSSHVDLRARKVLLLAAEAERGEPLRVAV